MTENYPVAFLASLARYRTYDRFDTRAQTCARIVADGFR